MVKLLFKMVYKESHATFYKTRHLYEKIRSFVFKHKSNH